MKLSALQAQQNYTVARAKLAIPETPQQPTASPEEDNGFKALHDVISTVADGEREAANFVAGRADPHSVVTAIAAAELAVETATAVRDRAVEAYQELLRMPI